jgi:hypothetical protein
MFVTVSTLVRAVNYAPRVTLQIMASLTEYPGSRDGSGLGPSPTGLIFSLSPMGLISRPSGPRKG